MNPLPDNRDTDVFGDNHDRRVISSDDSAEDVAKLVNTGPSSHRELIPDKVIRKESDGMFAAATRCPLAVIGLVAGKEQRNFKEICAKHEGVNIEIAKKNVEENAKDPATKPFIEWLDETRCSNIQVIAPTKELVAGGLEDIQTRVDAAIKRAPFTHLVSLPFLEKDNGAFMTNIEAFKKHVLENSTLDKECIDESVMVSPRQIHFTLLMLRIYDQETLDTVIATLDRFTKALKAKQHCRFPLRLQFRGVYIFDTDKPTRANVVFTHAGVRTVLKPKQQAPPAQLPSPTQNKIDAEASSPGEKSNGDETRPREEVDFQMAVTRAARVVTQANTKLKKVLTIATENELKQEQKQLISQCTEKLTPISEMFRQIIKNAPEGKRVTRGRPSENSSATGATNNLPHSSTRGLDISTVSGPVVSDIFSMFETLVKELSEAKVLTEDDRKERRIQRDPNNASQLSPQSLTLHLTLMSSKWRPTSITRKLHDSRRRSRVGNSTGVNRNQHPRPKPVTMDVSKFLSDSQDFGEALISELHLSRRVVTGPGEFMPEKIYKLD